MKLLMLCVLASAGCSVVAAAETRTKAPMKIVHFNVKRDLATVRKWSEQDKNLVEALVLVQRRCTCFSKSMGEIKMLFVLDVQGEYQPAGCCAVELKKKSVCGGKIKSVLIHCLYVDQNCAERGVLEKFIFHCVHGSLMQKKLDKKISTKPEYLPIINACRYDVGTGSGV